MNLFFRVQALELDPITFMPSVSLKYGRLLEPTTAHSLRIEIHPACLASLDAAAESAYQEALAAPAAFDDDEEDEFYGERKAKPKFGQDLLEEQLEADPTVWEGDWDGQEVRSLGL